MSKRRKPIMVDLFAGLGGFHVGLSRLGLQCALACEADSELRDIYTSNHGIVPHPDIRTLKPRMVPDHDILCAGFPCQPFSKAGEQLGLDCDRDGDLFGHLLRLIRAKRPRYLMLENVANLQKHAQGETWREMAGSLRRLGYTISTRVMSPHEFGIPQIRKRFFIVGSQDGLHSFEWPSPLGEDPLIDSVLDVKPKEARRLPDHYKNCLDVWQQFIDAYPARNELPSFPIWSFEFGATYPYTGTPPALRDPRSLSRYRGSHGHPLKGMTASERLQCLPSYARGTKPFPEWKQAFIAQNRQLYKDNKKWIDKWIRRIRPFSPSLQKLEWNCKGERRKLTDHIIQFRASGIRVKRSNWAPALVAMTTTQVPVITREYRYMTIRECARLQGLGELSVFPEASTRAYRALGNAVNADLVCEIGRQLLLPAKRRIACVA